MPVRLLATLLYAGLVSAEAHAQRILLGSGVPLFNAETELRIGPVQYVLVHPTLGPVVVGDVHHVMAYRGPRHSETQLINLAASPLNVGQVAAIVSIGPGILLLDRGRPQVVSLNLRGESLVFASANNIALLATNSACTASHGVVVSALTDPIVQSKVLHRIDSGGSVVDSEVGQTSATSGFMSSVYAVRLLACNTPSRLVWSASQFFGDLNLIDWGRGVRWSVTLPGFSAIRLTNPDAGTLMPELPPGGRWDELVGVWRLQNGMLLVQVMRNHGRVQGAGGLTSFLVDEVSGRILGTQTDLPRFVGASATRLFSVGLRSRDSLRAHSFDVVRTP